jgi:IS5 family transposase
MSKLRLSVRFALETVSAFDWNHCSLSIGTGVRFELERATGLIRACKVTKARGMDGNAEVLAALELAEEHMKAGQILVADRGYDRGGFVEGLRGLGVRAHPRAKVTNSVLDARLTAKLSYRESLKRRFIVEQPFAWIKGPGRMRQTTFKGTERVSWQFHLYALAYNLIKMAKLA